MGRSGNAVPGHFTMVAGSGMLVVHTDTGLRPTTKVQTALLGTWKNPFSLLSYVHCWK